MEKELHIIYTCDNNFLDQTAVSMASVIENNRDSKIVFYLATESEEHEKFIKIKEFYKNNSYIVIKYLDCTKYDELLESKGLGKWGSESYYAYRRLFAFDLLDCDYAWYLDSDMLCLSEINNPRLEEEKIFGAALDSAHADFNIVAHIPEKYYFFNTGVLFVDVKRWKTNKCKDKVIDYLNDLEYRPLMVSQDIITLVFQDTCQILSPKYNFLTGFDYYGIHKSFKLYSLDKKPFYTENEIEDARKDVVFYHCLQGVFGRPWQKGNSSPIIQEFLKYRELSAFKEYETKANDSALFKIEKKLEVLPDFIYIRIHNLAQKLYLKKLAKNAKI